MDRCKQQQELQTCFGVTLSTVLGEVVPLLPVHRAEARLMHQYLKSTNVILILVGQQGFTPFLPLSYPPKKAGQTLDTPIKCSLYTSI